MRNNENIIMAILILVIVAGLLIGFTREAKADEVEMTSSETLTEVEELNSEVNDLFSNVIEMRFYDKVEKGEITEEMLETLTSEELFALVMED